MKILLEIPDDHLRPSSLGLSTQVGFAAQEAIQKHLKPGSKVRCRELAQMESAALDLCAGVRQAIAEEMGSHETLLHKGEE